MADNIEISNAFVQNVLQDNERLRKENASLLHQVAALGQRVTDETNFAARERDDLTREIFQLVELLGGSVKIKAGTRGYKLPAGRRFFIERYDYDREVEYRIVDDPNEVAVFQRVFPELEAEAA